MTTIARLIAPSGSFAGGAGVQVGGARGPGDRSSPRHARWLGSSDSAGTLQEPPAQGQCGPRILATRAGDVRREQPR